MTWIHASLDQMFFYTPIEASAVGSKLNYHVPTLGNQVTWSVSLPRLYMWHAFAGTILVLYGCLIINGIIDCNANGKPSKAVDVFNACTVIITVMLLFLSIDYFDNFGQFWVKKGAQAKWEKAVEELTNTSTATAESILSGKQINDHAKTYIKHLHELGFISEKRHKAYQDKIDNNKMSDAMAEIEKEDDVSQGPYVMCPVNVLCTLYHKTQNKLFALHAKQLATMEGKRVALSVAHQQQLGRDKKLVHDVLGRTNKP